MEFPQKILVYFSRNKHENAETVAFYDHSIYLKSPLNSRLFDRLQIVQYILLSYVLSEVIFLLFASRYQC